MAIEDIYRGNTKTFKFTFKDAAGAVIDITGWTIMFMAKAATGDVDASATINVASVAGSETLDDPPNGLMYLVLDITDTDVAHGAYHYEFRRIIPGTPNDVKTLELDSFHILETVMD